jgi:signal transduction histidine kinase
MPQFRAKARAIELLGKGQIADLPTAITELWKNGYDAYAKKLECNLYLKSYNGNSAPFFVLSDDGFGMTNQDILDKWLVLGTDSKSRGDKVAPEFDLAERPPMGEKGIGRLSVSYLGNTLLMITKKKDKPTECLFIDWRVLENYNFYLDDLELPLFSFSSINDFSKETETAIKKFQLNFPENKWKEQEGLRQNILTDLKSLSVPDFIKSEIVTPFLQKDYHGTSFLIFKPHEQLLELDSETNMNYSEDLTVKYIRSTLTGLHNDLNGSRKDFETAFCIYNSAGKYDLIDDFFTSAEMHNGDHWLKGSFDENGFFSGEIRVFNQRFKHTFKPIRPYGRTSYGPFDIQWGQFEGLQKSSLLNEEEFRIIETKLEKFGGLYIYRDNFRVLPYGRPDIDFLGFEERRSKRAGEYFFSHRRFIGYIDITRSMNPGLNDKAGREGFIQNKAYRDFRDDLIAFFIDLAIRYLKTSSVAEDNTTSRATQIKEIQEKYGRLQEAEKKKSAKTKTAFFKTLEVNQDAIVNLKQEVDSIQLALKEESEKMEINFNSYNLLISQLGEKRASYRSMKLSAPRAIKFTKKQQEAYNNFQEVYTEVETEIATCIEIVEENRKRITAQNLRQEFQSIFDAHTKRIDQSFSSYISQIKDAFELKKDDLKLEKDRYVQEFVEQSGPLKLSETDGNEEIAKKISFLDKITEEQNKQITDIIGGFVNQVKNLSIDVDDDYLRGWYKEQSEKLQTKLEDYEELAQLGISIEIIDHQFNVMYSQMKNAIGNFKLYSDKNSELTGSFVQLNNAFQHLEGNYNLLRPLYRTSRRTRTIITGAQLENYIRSFFKNEFTSYNINFVVNEEFKKYEFFTYESIIKPVFLNIINNANYWLIPSKERKIIIEAKGDEILIMNSGERIEDSYLDDIFTLFFTKKKNGRGIGLYLAKKNLNSIGYEIFATNKIEQNRLKGACFVIKKKQSEI